MFLKILITNNTRIAWVLFSLLFTTQIIAGQRGLHRKTLKRPPINQTSNISIWDQNFNRKLLKNENLILQAHAINTLSYYSIHESLVKQHLTTMINHNELDARSLIILAEVCLKSEFKNICNLAGFYKKRLEVDPYNLFTHLNQLLEQINHSQSISYELQQDILNSTHASYYFAKGLTDFNQAFTNHYNKKPLSKKDFFKNTDHVSESDQFYDNLYKENYIQNFISKNIWSASRQDSLSHELISILLELEIEELQLHIYNLLSQSDNYSSQLVGLGLLKKHYKKTKNYKDYSRTSLQRAKISSTLGCLNKIKDTLPTYKNYKWNTPIYYQAYNEVVEQQGKLAAEIHATNTLKNHVSQIENNHSINDCDDLTKLSNKEYKMRFNTFDFDEKMSKDFNKL